MYTPISGRVFESNPYYKGKIFPMRKGNSKYDIATNDDHSYVQGRPKHGLVYTSLPDLLDRRAQTMPTKEAHVFWNVNEDEKMQRKTITFGDLAIKSIALANEFIQLGLLPEDRIILAGKNSPEWIYTEYAALRMQILVLKIPEELITGTKLVKIVSEFSCRAIVIDPGRKNSTLKKIVKNLPGIKSVSDLGSSKVRVISLSKPSSKVSVQYVQELIEDNKAPPGTILGIQKKIIPDDDAIVNTSSGSTGFPKFAVMSHFSILNNMYAADKMQMLDLMVRFFNDRPFSWVGSFLYSAVAFGITMIHMDPSFTSDSNNAKAIFDVFEEEEVSVSIFMPSFLKDAALAKDVICPKTLRYIITGGDTIPPDISKFCKEKFEGTVVIYASAESAIAATHFIQPDEKISPSSPSKLNVALDPLQFVEFRITDVDGVVLSVNFTGELWVRSPYNLKYFLAEKDKRDDTLVDGWVNTGDIALINSKKQVEILGRNMPIKKKNGGVVYPVVMEFFLRTFPKIADAVVISIADDDSANNICACVVFQQGYHVSPSGLRQFFTRNLIADEGIVQPKHFLIFDQFPHLRNGKIDRKKIIVMAIDRLDEGEGHEESD